MRFHYLTWVCLVSAAASAVESDLAKTQVTTEGYCTANVLRLIQAPKAPIVNDADKAFVSAAIARARGSYLATTLTYIEGAEAKGLKISGTQFKKKVDRFNRDTSRGLIVTVDQGGDEDGVDFYFIESKQKPALLMAFHNEQSAQAYWPCEID